MNKAWVIKLGSGGRCTAFCESRQVVGLGWKDVDTEVLRSASREQLLEHITEKCTWYETNAARSGATGQLYRFAHQCSAGDYVLYYDPPGKKVVLTRVAGDLERRVEDGDRTDIWQMRRVERVREVSVLEIHGALKGRILGPRMSFWELRPFEIVDDLAHGRDSGARAAPDPEFLSAYARLKELIVRRASALNDRDWEWLVVDYFKAQGAHIDERVGGNRPIIDVEAVFDHGELGEETWRIQVKRFQDKSVDWRTIKEDWDKVREARDDVRFCFVSAFGFTPNARVEAAAADVRLMEAGDFTKFVLGGKLRTDVARKLDLPTLDA
jgi:hypothetical protein